MNRELEKVKIAASFWQKTFGVMGWKNWGNYSGLLLTNTSSIHTFFVNFPLDIVFLDKDYKVLHLVENLRPWRVSPIVTGAKHTLELPTNGVRNHKLAVGDEIILK